MTDSLTVLYLSPSADAAIIARDLLGTIRTVPFGRETVSDVTALASAVREACSEVLEQEDSPRVVLAIPGNQCFSAPVHIAKGLPTRHQRDAWLFALEDVLPVAAEDVAADFVVQDAADDEEQARALAVAARLETIEPLVAALDAGGVQTWAVCPTATLLAAGLATPLTSTGVAVVDDTAAEVVGLDDTGRLASWTYARRNGSGVLAPRFFESLNCQELYAAGAMGVANASATKAVADSLSIAGRKMPCHASEDDFETLLLAGAKALASGNAAVTVNLRRDALADPHAMRHLRTPMLAACLSLLVLTLSLAGTLAWRGGHYNTQADAHRADAIAVYRDSTGHQGPPPISLTRRMRTTVRQLQGTSGQHAGDGDNGTPRLGSALNTLYTLIDHAPVNIRMTILSARIDQDKVAIHGQVRSPADADRLRTAIQNGRRGAQGGARFEMEEVETRRLREGKGVRFDLVGRVVTEPVSAAPQQASAGGPR